MPTKTSLTQAVTSAVGSFGIPLGVHTDGADCVYDPSQAVNGHVCILGMSGAGKSHTIRYLAHAYRQYGMTVFIPDVQDDLGSIPDVHDIPFRYRGSQGSVNPLRVDPDPDAGGVDIAIRQAIYVIRMFASHMGARQEADLRTLLELTYRDKGLKSDDPTTWTQRAPTLVDVLSKARQVHIEVTDGIGPDVFTAIANGRTELVELRADKADQATIEAAKAELVKDVTALVEKGLKGDDLRRKRWDGKRLESIIHLLEGIVSTGLFNGDDLHAHIRKGLVNRFVLTNLHKVDQKVILHLLLERVFDYAKRTCRRLNPPVPHIVLVLDEGKYASAWMDDKLSPLNQIATEGRKYGLALVMGVQSLRHLSEDAAENFGMTMVLKLSDMACKRAAQIFRVPEALLEQIEAKRNALVSINGSRFRRITLTT